VHLVSKVTHKASNSGNGERWTLGRQVKMIHPVYTMLNCEMRHPAIRELDIFASGPGCSYISGDESSEIWRVTEGAELISSPRESL
jgi:hypothetical protein